MRTGHKIVLVIAGAAGAVLLAQRLADAHDFWLVPDAFQIADGGVLSVRGQTSSKFPTSESAVTPDRVTEVRVLGANEDVRVTDVTVAGTSMLLRHRPTGAGQRIVAAALAWRSVRASGPGFKRYIELEGNAALAARYERAGMLPKTDSITRRYAKYAKVLVQVGSGGPTAFGRVLGQPAEFIPLSDPARLRAGDTLALRLLYRGRPLAQASVHAGVARAGEAPLDFSFEADAQGIVRVPISQVGLWNVRTLHVVPSDPGTGADWDSHFATLVFSVAGR